MSGLGKANMLTWWNCTGTVEFGANNAMFASERAGGMAPTPGPLWLDVVTTGATGVDVMGGGA